MSQQLTEELIDLRRREWERWLKEGKDLPDPVFASEAGTMLDEANVRHLFRRVLVKAGLRLIRFHDLRHTYASLLIRQGEPLAYVKDQMGHKSIQITVDTYGHLVPGGNRAAVDRLDDEPTQPNATQAQPEGSGAGAKVKKVVVSRTGIEPENRSCHSNHQRAKDYCCVVAKCRGIRRTKSNQAFGDVQQNPQLRGLNSSRRGRGRLRIQPPRSSRVERDESQKRA